jgi:hypothetical protein
MLLSAADKILKQIMIDGFETNQISYTFDNAPDDSTPQEQETEKVKCIISFLSSSQASLGGVGTRVFRRTGDIVCRVYTPKDTGTRRDTTIVDIILNLFEGQSFSGIVTQDISFLRLGTIGDWHLTTVRIPFYFHIEDI